MKTQSKKRPAKKATAKKKPAPKKKVVKPFDYKSIDSFEAACRKVKIKPIVPEFEYAPKEHRKALQAHYKLIIINQAMNNGYKPNWNNPNEYKYYPWFYIQSSSDQPAGFGFSSAYFVFTYTRTGVGSRLCFATSEMALWAAEKFKQLYQDYFLIEPVSVKKTIKK